MNSVMMNTASYGQSESISGNALFMKSNSTAHIIMKYVTQSSLTSTYNTERGIYDSNLQDPQLLTSNDLIIQSEPKSINTSANNTVTYTIVAINNVKGIYAIPLSTSCGFSPLVVGLNESDISNSKLFKFFTAIYNCPVMSSQTPNVEIISYDGIISKNIVIPADQLSPLQQFQSRMIKNIQCKQGFIMILKSEDGSSVCVTPDTANILIERGWAKSS
ncbi:MAG TPA: hypothetical protein VFJ23_05160 [Candidatus Nitrosotalea sp.]|nr:hypothetical protein [Candidatus Nitrosotalea sp.]